MSEELDRLVDRSALASFLEDAVGPADGLSVERHQAGHSNETVFVRWGDREFVLRRPPAGATAESAHDVLREARFMDALADTTVPVPEIVATCDDHEVIGSDFVVMERLEGDVVRTVEPDRFATPDQRRRIGETLLDTLVAIHDVDPEAVGLGEVGRPAGYLERQVDTWRTQLEEWLLPATEHDRPVPAAGAVGEWLASNVPEEAAHRLVHGDYKLDNVMLGPGTPPTIVGVFDWEMATLGDPLADLAWLLLFWRDADDPEPDLPAELTPRLTAREGYPTRPALIERYESATGIDFEHRRFYYGLAAYKIATACEAMYFRYRSGEADDPMYPHLEAGVPAMMRRARRIVDGEAPIVT